MMSRIKVPLLCVFAGAALISSGAAVKSLSTVESTAPPKDAVVGDKADAAYWLYDNGGYVAVYGGSEIEITDIEIETLTDYDKKLLKEGIPVKDKTQLLTLLEDLGS